MVVYSTPVLLDTVTADASGVATWSGTLPASLEDGEHTLTFQGSVDRGLTFTLARATAAVGQCTVEGATLKWGYKESFRTYIEGIAKGGWTLTGVTYKGTLDLSASSASLTIVNGIALSDITGNNPGTINLTGISSVLVVKGNTTLDNATINIGGSGGTPDLFNQDGVSGGSTLTLGPNLTIIQAGAFAQINGTSTTGETVLNQGTINSAVANATFTIAPLNFTNSGALIAGATHALITGERD